MKAYKIFENDWTCKGFKYEVGKTYKHRGNVILCVSGFHACTNPLDLMKYKDIIHWNKFALVECSGTIRGPENDCSKISSSNIKILKELSFDDLIEVIKKYNYSPDLSVNYGSGVSNSSGINFAYGVSNSDGVSNGIFVNNKKTSPMLFNKEISLSRYNEVMDRIIKLSNGWHPEVNNLKSLYLKNGSKWECTPIHKAKEISNKEAWSGMPKKMLDYIKSLPEFDAEIFKEITDFRAILHGKKKSELRIDDGKDFQVGDYLDLYEVQDRDDPLDDYVEFFNPGRFLVRITYVLNCREVDPTCDPRLKILCFNEKFLEDV